MTTTTTTATTTTAPSEPEALPRFLDVYAAMHAGMRRDASRLLRAVDRIPTAPGTTRPALHAWWRHFEAVIVQHHGREDVVLWPALEARAPEFAADRSRLVEDHEQLDRAMAAVGAALAGTGGDLVPAVSTFADLLVDHLAREEAAAFPLLAAHFDEAEYRSIEKQLAKGATLRSAAFELPWVLDGANAETRESVAAILPAPMRVLNRVFWERRYRRIAAPLLGS